MFISYMCIYTHTSAYVHVCTLIQDCQDLEVQETAPGGKANSVLKPGASWLGDVKTGGFTSLAIS